MRGLDNVAVADAYAAGATIQDLYSGRTLVFLVANASAYMQIQRPTQQGAGGGQWSSEFLVNPSTGGFQGVIGVRFRNAVAGSVARVIAQIWEISDPQPTGGTPFPGVLLSTGAVVASDVITGIIPAAGTTPTAGTGFTYTHTNGTGIYVFTLTTALAAAPVVLAMSTDPAHKGIMSAENVTAGGFTINSLENSFGTPADQAFNFTVTAVA